jgi:antimicrobial peptide system SdpA family protein
MRQRTRRGGANRARAAAAALFPQRALGAFVFVVGTMWAVLIGYVVHVQLPTNVIVLPFEQELHLAAVVFAPEGWAFFTKNPREPVLIPYTMDTAGMWRSAAVGAYDDPPHLFGASRSPRAQGVEMGLLSSQISPTAWGTCDERIETCLARAASWFVAGNPSPQPTLCGKVALVRQEPLPWAWASARAETTMPSTFVLVDSRC